MHAENFAQKPESPKRRCVQAQNRDVKMYSRDNESSMNRII